MPQLDTSSFFSQLFWLAVTFLVLYFAMVKFVLPAIREVLQARHDRIANDLEKAELARKEAEAAKASYMAALEKARHNAVLLLTDTSEKLKKEMTARYAELDRKIDQQVAEADAKIAVLKEKALQEVDPMATTIGLQLIHKLVRKPYEVDKVEEAVRLASQSMKQ